MPPADARTLNDSSPTAPRDGGDGGRTPPLPDGVRAAAFWAAVVLPFLALAHILTGVETTGEWGLLGSLVLLDAVALFVGHPYGAEGR